MTTNSQPMSDFTHLVEGDRVVRSLGGVPMPMIVLRVDDDNLYCIQAGEREAGRPPPDALREYQAAFDGCFSPEEFPGWTFDRRTGTEIDVDLHWGPSYGVTGSYLVEEAKRS
jgi:hypothetical protein